VFVQVRGLQASSDDPEPSLITSKWHILCHMARGQAVCSFWIRRSSVRAQWRQTVFAQVSGLEPPSWSARNRPWAMDLWHIRGTSWPIYGMFQVLRLNSAGTDGMVVAVTVTAHGCPEHSDARPSAQAARAPRPSLARHRSYAESL